MKLYVWACLTMRTGSTVDVLGVDLTKPLLVQPIGVWAAWVPSGPWLQMGGPGGPTCQLDQVVKGQAGNVGWQRKRWTLLSKARHSPPTLWAWTIPSHCLPVLWGCLIPPLKLGLSTLWCLSKNQRGDTSFTSWHVDMFTYSFWRGSRCDHLSLKWTRSWNKARGKRCCLRFCNPLHWWAWYYLPTLPSYLY